jgi:long-chain acyl-CoA synthetase
MSIALAAAESLKDHANQIVVRDTEQELSGGQLLAATRRVAARLAASPGERIGILLPNCASYPAALLGALWAGKTAVPLNPLLKPAEIDFLLQDAAIQTVIVSEPTRALVADLAAGSLNLTELFQGSMAPESPAATDVNAPAVMLYTSGTSGKPKGVPLTHNNMLGNARSLIASAQLESADRFVGVLPMFHAFALTGTLVIPLLLGAEVTYLRFTPERAANVITERRVTVFIGVPGMFGLLARGKGPEEGLRNLKFPVSGGEALPPRIREGFRQRFGRPIYEGYGLTETSPVIAVNLPGRHRPGSVGKPVEQVRVRIASEQGAALPAGQEGEIQVTGPNVMKGYYRRPDENATAFTADGWFRTGDLGRLDEEGYLSISGRIKEIIIRAGEKIMPREVEEVLTQHPGVQEAAVIGEPDGDRGEAVVAYLVPAGPQPPAADELREFCRPRLAEFKIPRRFTVASDLPRGPTGKILKRALGNWKPG